MQVNKSESFYVGDAAGRAKGWAKDKPKDFSCSDRMFAANIGIGKFRLPLKNFLYFLFSLTSFSNCTASHQGKFLHIHCLLHCLMY